MRCTTATAQNHHAFTLLEILLAVSLMAVISAFMYTWLLQSHRGIQEDTQSLRVRRDILASVLLLRDDLLERIPDNGPKIRLTVTENTIQLHSYHHAPGDKAHSTIRTNVSHMPAMQHIKYTLKPRGFYRSARAISASTELYKRSLWQHPIKAHFEQDDDALVFIVIREPFRLRLRLSP